MKRRRTLQLTIAVLAFLVGTSNVWAQAVASATIRGRVVDETNAALPGVTITATSPALQVPQRVQTTGADGTYVFRNLPAGTYRLSYELAGFSTVNREGLELPVAFQSTVNITMGLASVAETVTVTGESPVVDVTSTGTASNFSVETLETVPRGSDFSSIVDMAPGVTRQGIDVGGSELGSRSDMSTYGMVATPKIEVEGINITTGSDENTAVYFNYFLMDEVQIKTSGTSAEVGTPGLHLIGVAKSGGNEFHGSYMGGYSGSQMQSSNLNAELQAQGLQDTNPLKFHYEVAGDLGGRIIRDKLWFYGGISRQHRRSAPLGAADGPGPDGEYLTGDEPIAYFNGLVTDYTGKVSWQLSENNKIVGMYMYGDKRQPQRDLGRFVPLESTKDYHDPTWIRKLEWQSMISDNVLLNVVGGYGGYFADYNAMRTPLYRGPDYPSKHDLESGLRTGGGWTSDQRPRDNWQMEGSVSYYSPGGGDWGSHELKTGINFYRYLHGTGKLNHPHGNYELNYQAGDPIEILLHNYPSNGRNRLNVFAGYVQDNWQLRDNLTLNLGVRVEHQNGFVPEQSYGGSSQFPGLFPPGSFDKIDVITWNSVLPRLGFAWDVGGEGRSVLKASFGLYNDQFRDADMNRFNGNADRDALFRWTDPNGSGNYEPGEVNLDLNGPDFISIEGASNNIINPDLIQPKTVEFTVSFERELAANMGVRFGFVHRQRKNAYDFGGINILRPFEVYNIPLDRRDPGPDGILDTADDGGVQTIYDYDPAYRGADFVSVQQVNSDKVDKFDTFEAAFTKKLSNNWTLTAAGFAVKNNRWIERQLETPNVLPFPKDETWNYSMNFSGFYQLPYGMRIAGFLRARTGTLGQRTVRFARNDPDGGPSLQQLSSVTLKVEEYGSQYEGDIVIADMRFTKDFELSGGSRFGISVDLYNLFNSAAITGANYQSGSTFGYADEVINPRIVRIRGTFQF